MRKNYDVPKQLERIISEGFSNPKTWRADAGLFVRWKKFAEPELKKKDIKQRLIEKCRKTLMGFNYDLLYEDINDIVNKNIKVDFYPLKIESVQFSQSAMNWFIEQGLHKNESKFLFALYMVYVLKQVEKNISDPLTFYKNDIAYFMRNNSCIAKTISIKKLFKYLEDVGYITWTGNKGSLLFVENNNILQCKYTIQEKNTNECLFNFYIGNEDIDDMTYIFTTEDLDTFGNKYWAIVEGYKLCPKCHQVIPKVKNKKYCDECAKQIHLEQKREHAAARYVRKENKQLICERCGAEFVISSRGQRTICDECYKIERRKKKTETMKKLRGKQPVVNDF